MNLWHLDEKKQQFTHLLFNKIKPSKAHATVTLKCKPQMSCLHLGVYLGLTGSDEILK